MTSAWTLAASAAAIAGALILVDAGPTAAQGVSRPTIDVEEIVPDEVRDTPGAATALTSAEIEALRPFTLHDALVFVPGIVTIDDDALGRRTGIGIRGAPPRRSRKTLLLEDGTPVNASTYLDPSAHYTPPLERLERIDVLKGAGHIPHGPLNNHGIVNFRNKRPTEVPETALELGLGNLGTFRRHLMHRRTDGPIGLVLSYTGANADGTFDVESHRYDDFFGSADVAVGERQTVGVSATYFRERSHYDESNLLPQEFALAPRRKLGRFNQELNTIGVNYWKTDIVHNLRLGERFSVSTKVFTTNLDRPRFTVDPGESPVELLPAVKPADPFRPGVEGLMVGRDRHYRNTGAESRMQLGEVQASGLAQTLQWGVRIERHALDDRRTEGAPGEALDSGRRGRVVRDEAYDATAVSAFVQDAVRLGPEWTLTPGVRVERYTQGKQRMPSPNHPEGRQREHDVNVLLLPSVSLLYGGLPETAIFANVGRGYTPAFARTAAAFPLDPETGVNTQVGFRTRALRGVAAEGALFYNAIRGTVVQLPFTIDNQNVFLNSEHSRSYGLDVTARVNSAAYTGSLLNAFAAAVYTHTRTAFTAGIVDGNRVPEIPTHSGSLSVGLEHAAGWDVSVTVSHVGAFFTDPANTRVLTLADEHGDILQPEDDFDLREPVVLGLVPAHTLVSARVGYDIAGTPLSVWLQGRNLADALYITDLANGLRPGAARTVSAGLRWQF